MNSNWLISISTLRVGTNSSVPLTEACGAYMRGELEIQVLGELILEAAGDVVLHDAERHDVEVGVARVDRRRVVGVARPQGQLGRRAPLGAELDDVDVLHAEAGPIVGPKLGGRLVEGL